MHSSSTYLVAFSKRDRDMFINLPHILWQLCETYQKLSQYLSIKPQPQFLGIHGIQPRPQPWKMSKNNAFKILTDKNRQKKMLEYILYR